MPFLFQYLVKFSLSLAALYTFYYIVLRPLTFYQWNRFYLVCYSLLSFVIPFINVTDWLTGKNMKDSYLLNSIPAVNKLTSRSFHAPGSGTKILSALLSWDFMGLLFLMGAIIMFARIIYQYLSLRNMKRKAVLLKTGDFEFYDVNGPIAPFSFANAIFINSRLHSEEEFHKILEHEFVHVKQKHTIDIVVAELVCVFNWFNPFAWGLRKSIRQNLEFIADNNVLDGGIDPRQYQYLLLKVMGLPQYSITNNFSFSSLKKRIVMMNKMKTARVHLVKFLFILPLLAVMLLAFRERISFQNNDQVIYTGFIINVENYEPLKNVMIRVVNTNVETQTDERGYFKITIPVKNDSGKLKVQVLKDGVIKREFKSSWISSGQQQGARTILYFVGINKEQSVSGACEKCFISQQELEVNNSVFNQMLIQNKFTEFLQQRKTADTLFTAMRQSAAPILKAGNKLYVVTGNVPFNNAVSKPAEFSFMMINSVNPVIYLNGKITTLEHINSSISRIEIKEIISLDKKEALKKYGESTENLLEIKTYSGIGSDTIPKLRLADPVPPVNVPLAEVIPSPPLLTVKPVKGPTPPPELEEVHFKISGSKTSGYNEEDKENNEKIIFNRKIVASKNAVDLKQVNGELVLDTIPPKFIVRGISQKAADEPLFVIDGVRLSKGKGVQDIDPDSIKEVRVLKDAHAIEFYGKEAKSGVIEIRTKDNVSIKAETITFTGRPGVTVKAPQDFKGLLLVDGVEVGNDKLSSIDADNIESISVLKSGAATSIYNDKGKNGVILITTKKVK